MLIGIGVAGCLDEPVFHQLLHWHHFYDKSTPTVGLVFDRFFHAGKVIDLPRAHPVQFGLHHYREQGLIDPPTPLQQRGERTIPPAASGSAAQITGGRGQRPRPGTVALGAAVLAAFVRAGADHRGQLRLDQRLGRGFDPVFDVGNFQRLEEFEQCWSKTIAWPFSFRMFLGGFTQGTHALHVSTSPTSLRSPTSYTTSRDLTGIKASSVGSARSDSGV